MRREIEVAIPPGAMRHRIRIDRRTVGTAGPHGGRVDSWATIHDLVPAYVETSGGRWAIDARAAAAEVSHRFAFRWSPELDTLRAEDRITMAGRNFGIVWLENVQARNRYIRAYTVELVT